MGLHDHAPLRADYCSQKCMATESLRDSKVYEIGYLLISSIPPEKVEDEVTFIKGLLEKGSASVIAEGAPELQKLAYEMRKKIGAVYHKYQEGYFGWIKFELEPSKIEAVKTALDARESVLRQLIITTTKENIFLGKTLTAAKAEEVAAAAEKEVVVAEGEVAAPVNAEEVKA